MQICTLFLDKWPFYKNQNDIFSLSIRFQKKFLWSKLSVCLPKIFDVNRSLSRSADQITDPQCQGQRIRSQIYVCTHTYTNTQVRKELRVQIFWVQCCIFTFPWYNITKRRELFTVKTRIKLATLVEGDPKAPFSLATTPRCRGGCYSIPWIASLYHWSLPYSDECQASRHQVPFLSL